MSECNWKWGETRPISASVNADVEIRIGQMVFLNHSNEAVPASNFEYDHLLTKLENQKRFKEKFLGVTLQSCVLGREHPIRIATVGAFEFDLADVPLPEPLLLGQYFTAAIKDGNFSDRILEPCEPEVGIVRLVHTESVPPGKCIVAVRSTITERWY